MYKACVYQGRAFNAHLFVFSISFFLQSNSYCLKKQNVICLPLLFHFHLQTQCPSTYSGSVAVIGRSCNHFIAMLNEYGKHTHSLRRLLLRRKTIMSFHRTETEHSWTYRKIFPLVLQNFHAQLTFCFHRIFTESRMFLSKSFFSKSFSKPSQHEMLKSVHHHYSFFHYNYIRNCSIGPSNIKEFHENLFQTFILWQVFYNVIG